MRAIELFAGVGGFRIALERAGHEVVWANEFNKDAADIYDRNFGGQVDRRDITTIPITDIPDHDILVGGFPCQAFSIAGNRKGFDETRGTLFFDIARITKAKQPRHLLLENVRGLLHHDSGRTFKTILSTLNELGYDSETMVLDGSNYGAGQRPRVFIFATHRQYQPDVLKGAEQATSVHPSSRQGTRLSSYSLQEVGRNSGRIIRTFAELPDWLDSWQTLYGKEAANG